MVETGPREAQYSPAKPEVEDSLPLLGDLGTTTLSCDSPAPISRSPSQPRDGWYAVGFLGHFAVTILLSFAEGGKRETESAFLMSGYDAGSWASILMIVCLLSAIIGLILAGFGLMDSSVRGEVLSAGVLMANILVQICVGNTFLLLKQHYSFGLYFLSSALMCLVRYRMHASRLAFLGSLMDLVTEIFTAYQYTLVVACALALAAQTLVLLWWGAFFVSLFSSSLPLGALAGEWPTLLFLLFSWYWITQFFQALVSFVLGGCVLWYYEARRLEGREEVNPGGARVRLYSTCALTSSLGSVCKGGLYAGLSSRVLSLSNLFVEQRDYALALRSTYVVHFYDTCIALMAPLTHFARRNNKLALSISAAYGFTYSKSGIDQYNKYPQSVDMLLLDADEEMQTLNALGNTVAGTMALVFALSAQNTGSSRSLFLLLVYLMAYSGVTLSLHCYSAAIYGFVVAYSNEETIVPPDSIPVLRWGRKLEERRHGVHRYPAEL
jgi:hypothetical protein